MFFIIITQLANDNKLSLKGIICLIYQSTLHVYFVKKKIEKHHVSQHNKKCFMSQANLELISEYFTESVTDVSLLKRKTFHQYCVKSGILSPVSMGQYFNQKHFKTLIIQLLIVLYKYTSFDWEMAELIIFHITNGSFYMSNEILCQLKKQVRENRGLSNIDTSSNYQALINAMVDRAVLDLNFVIGNTDENSEVITEECIIDAIEFLNYMHPEKVSKARYEGKCSTDTELLVWRHVGLPVASTE